MKFIPRQHQRPRVWSSHAQDRLPAIRDLKETISNISGDGRGARHAVCAIGAVLGSTAQQVNAASPDLERGGAAVARQAHNLKVGGSNPLPANLSGGVESRHASQALEAIASEGPVKAGDVGTGMNSPQNVASGSSAPPAQNHLRTEEGSSADAAKQPLEVVSMHRDKSRVRSAEFSFFSPNDRSELRSTDWLGWLRGKLADAERALTAREQEAAVWKSGTNKSWAESAKLHSDTAKLPPLTKAARVENASRAERIAVKCRRDVEGFKAVIETLSQPNSDIRRELSVGNESEDAA